MCVDTSRHKLPAHVHHSYILVTIYTRHVFQMMMMKNNKPFLSLSEIQSDVVSAISFQLIMELFVRMVYTCFLSVYFPPHFSSLRYYCCLFSIQYTTVLCTGAAAIHSLNVFWCELFMKHKLLSVSARRYRRINTEDGYSTSISVEIEEKIDVMCRQCKTCLNALMVN